MIRTLLGALIFLFSTTIANTQETDIRKVAWWKSHADRPACNVRIPGIGSTPGSYVFYLPPDVPDPVCISQVMINVEQEVPADMIFTYGPMFAALDRGSTYLNCSHWPGAQDCVMPASGPGGNQFGSLVNLGWMQPEPGKATLSTTNHIHPICYRRGDAILIGVPCATADGSTTKFVNPTISFGLIYPKYTPATACDTHTKLLLHGGAYPDPATGESLPHFISDSSPNWHAIGSFPSGSSVSNVTIDKTIFHPLTGADSSIKFDGTANTMVWTPASGDFRVGSQDWAIDLWWRPGSVMPGIFQQIMALDGYTMSLGQIGDELRFSASSNGTSWNMVPVVNFGSVTLGQFTHVTVQRVGDNILLSQDGVLKQTAPVSGALWSPANTTLRFGNNYSGAYPATAHMQEVRFSRVARWPTGNYAIPTEPYPCPK